MTFVEARQYLLEQAKRRAVDAEILASETRELSLEAHGGVLSESTQATKGGIGLRVIVAGKAGYASTEERSPAALDWALAEAIENAELQSSSGAFLPRGQALGNKDLINEGLSAAIEEKADAILSLEAGLRKDRRLKEIFIARYTERETMVSIASTQGVNGGYRNGYSGIFSSFIMQDGESIKQGFDVDLAKDFHQLEPGKTALKMLESTGRLLGAKPLKTGKYRAYFEPKAFAQLLSIFFFMFSGKTLAEGKSRLANKLNKRIASDLVTIIDNPGLPQGLGNRPFDSEGSPAQVVTLVEKGILKSFLHNSATASETGQANTGHAARTYSGTLGVAPSNLFLQPGKGIELSEGIMVTSLSGLHAGANPITGDLSLQALGLNIEGGQVAHPVDNFVVSGNMLEILEKITELGETLEWQPFGGIMGSPLVEVAELSFAGA